VHKPHYIDAVVPIQSAVQSWLILVVGVLLLVTPLWALSLLDTEKKKLVSISVLIVAFVCVLAMGARARPDDVLAAAAA